MKIRGLIFIFPLILLNLSSQCSGDVGQLSLDEDEILCSNTIEYHRIDTCDDAIAIIHITDAELDRIELDLSQGELGDCVESIIGNPGVTTIFTAWFSNDENKSWILNDCR